MQKELLTKEKFKQDYKKQFVKNVKGPLIGMAIFLAFVLSVLVILFIYSKNHPYMIIPQVHIWIYFLVTLVPLVVEGFIPIIKEFKKLKCFDINRFYITTDVITDCRLKKGLLAKIKSLFKKIYVLHSPKFGEFSVPFDVDEYVMRGDIIGDTYYLVVYNNSEILLAYDADKYVYEGTNYKISK